MCGCMNGFDDYEMIDDGGVYGIEGVGLGAMSLNNFPTTAVMVLAADTLASNDEIVNKQLDKLSFLQDKTTGAVRLELRGGLKVAAGGLMLLNSNPIVQGLGGGLVVSGVNDGIAFAKQKGWLDGGNAGVPATTNGVGSYELSYDDFGMTGIGETDWSEVEQEVEVLHQTSRL